MNDFNQLEGRASRSRSRHEGESSYALCDRLSRTRDTSPRQLPTDHDHAVPTREYQTDQSSPTLPRLLLALPSKNKKPPTAVQRLTGSLHIRAVTDCHCWRVTAYSDLWRLFALPGALLAEGPAAKAADLPSCVQGPEGPCSLRWLRPPLATCRFPVFRSYHRLLGPLADFRFPGACPPVGRNLSPSKLPQCRRRARNGFSRSRTCLPCAARLRWRESKLAAFRPDTDSVSQKIDDVTQIAIRSCDADLDTLPRRVVTEDYDRISSILVRYKLAAFDNPTRAQHCPMFDPIRGKRGASDICLERQPDDRTGESNGDPGLEASPSNIDIKCYLAYRRADQ
jgi:hypothetical protein